MHGLSAARSDLTTPRSAAGQVGGGVFGQMQRGEPIGRHRAVGERERGERHPCPPPAEREAGHRRITAPDRRRRR